MIGLWRDIKDLSEKELHAALDTLIAPRPKKRGKSAASRSKKLQGPSDDRPVTRIAYHLRTVLEAPDPVLIERYRAALIEAGIRNDLLPDDVEVGLEMWLEALLGNVPDSRAFSIAKSVSVRATR